jgi:hypothetical protein
MTHKATLPDLKARIDKCLHNYIMNLCQRIKAWRLHFFRVRHPKKFNSFIIRHLLGLGHTVHSSVPTANPSHPLQPTIPTFLSFQKRLCSSTEYCKSEVHTVSLLSQFVPSSNSYICTHIYIVHDLLLGWSFCMQFILWSTCIGETSLSIAG